MKYLLSASLFSFVLAFSSLPALAQADYKELGLRLKNCKAITSLITRSQCYDTVVIDFNLDDLSRVDVGNSTGKWKVTTEKSPVDDGQNVFAAISADDYIRNSEGKSSQPSLVLRCREGKMEGYIIWDEHLGTEDVLINTRIGKGEQQGSRWKLSGDKMASFIPDPKAFSRQLMNQDTLYVSAWLKARDPLSTIFDLRGTNIAFQPLLQACP